MSRSSLGPLVILACCGILPLPVLALGPADARGENGVVDLGEVVSTGHKLQGIEAGETVHVITEKEIKKSGARTLDEVLVLLPDVDVRVGNDARPRVDIRGFRTRHVLLLVDGVPVNSAFDQQFDPSLIPIDNIAMVKVTVGASSVLYGQGGLGGVINIVTKRGQKGVRGTVGAERGDGAPYLVKTGASGAGGVFDFFLTGSLYRRDRFPLAKPFQASLEEAAGYRKNSDDVRRAAYLNLGVTPSQKLSFTFTGSVVQGGYGKPASSINDNFDPFASQPKFERVDYYLGYSFQLAADYAPSSAVGVRSVVYFNRMDQDDNQYDNDNYNSFDDPSVPNSFILRNKGLNRGVLVRPRLDLGRAGTLTLLASGEWDTWMDVGFVKSGGESGRADGGHGVGGGSYPFYLFAVQDHFDIYIYSAAAEYEISPFKDFHLVAGLGYYWQRRFDARKHDFGVSASAWYDLARGTRLKAAVQRNIRFPSLSQLYLRDSDNRALRTERVIHTQLGLEQSLGRKTALQVDAFRSELHDFIEMDQTRDPPKNENFSLAHIYGGEGALETRFLPGLRVKLGYTYLHTRDLSGDDLQELQYVPTHKATLSARYDFKFGLTPFVGLQYVAGTYVYSKRNFSPVAKEMMANYGLVSVKLTQKLFGDLLLLYVGADNLFNKDYEQSYGIPRPGRFVYGGLEVHLGSEGFSRYRTDQMPEQARGDSETAQ
jgi:vitamin B12 transporter